MSRNIFRNLAIVLALALGSVWSPAEHVTAQGSNGSSALQAESGGRQTDRIIVKYKTDAEPSDPGNGRVSPMEAPQEPQMSRLENETGVDLEYVRPLSSDDNAHVLQLPERLPEDQVEAISAELMDLPEVEYAEPDSIRYPVLTPNDTLYALQQWNLSGPWGINAPAAWDLTTGNSSVVIAVLDTGIVMHEDLNDRVIKGDAEGTIENSPGYDFIDLDYFGGSYLPLTANDGNGPESDARDPGDGITAAENAQAGGFFQGCGESTSSWHGTHVAGIIGAEGNNGIGVAGIDWNARILPVRVLGKCGGYISDIADGMRWAAGLTVSGVPANLTPAKIINLSLGGDGACSATEQNAINAVTTAGAVVVVASGNENYDLDVTQSSPANCNGVITVGATDENGERSSYSNYGSTVEISAPGDNIHSTSDSGTTAPANDNSYEDKWGTSMAAPHVSGVLGLMFAVNPYLTPSHASAILQSTAKDFPVVNGCDTTDCGAGIVDAAAAVQGADAVDLLVTGYQVIDPVTGLPLSAPVPNEPFRVDISVKNQGGSVSDSVVWGYVFIDVDPAPLVGVDGCVDLDTLTPLVDYFFKRDLNDTLAAGASAVIPIDVESGLPAGDHQIYPYVDANCINPEIFEDNNGYDPVEVTTGRSFIGGPADVDVLMGGALRGEYTILENEQAQDSYANLAAGPVKVVATTDNAIVMSERVMYSFNGVLESYYEMMGLSNEQLSTEYWYPYSTNVGVNTQIRFANAGNSTANVEVRIAGNLVGTYSVGVNAAGGDTYYNVVGGPVQVRSTNGVPIASTQRFIFTTDGVNPTSFAETLGMPTEQASTEYWFPIYNNSTTNSEIRISNIGNSTANVDIYMAGTKQGSTLSIPVNTTQFVSFPGVVAGPVRIVSTNGVKIVVTERVLYSFDGVYASYYEMMATPLGQLSTEYWYPYSTNIGVNTQIRFGNAGSTTANVEILIGGDVVGTYSVAPNSVRTDTFYNLADGPVVVRSTNGVPLTSTERFIFTKDGVTPTSFSETMGTPLKGLSDVYWIPIYNNLTTNSQIRLGNP